MGYATVTEYNPNNGGLMGIWSMETEDLDKIGVDNYIHGAYDKNFFFVDIQFDPPEIKERPEMEILQSTALIKADGVEVVEFSGLPTPCVVSVNDSEYEVDDGVFEWGTRLPGVYVFRVVAFPFLDWEGTVEAE